MEPKPRKLLTTNIYIPLLVNILLIILLGTVLLWNYVVYPPLELITRNMKDVAKAALLVSK